jgi:hypothetical protein
VLRKDGGPRPLLRLPWSGTGPQYLVKLSPGSTFWAEEQSRIIFRNVPRLVDRDDPMNSRILIHPLSPMAGGDIG